MKTNINMRTFKMVQLALLTAVILLMAFTPIGYIKTGGLSITLIVVPVTVGAIVLGPAGGAFLGGVFGATSFIQCFGMDPFGVVLLEINPVATFIVCMIPRILMGWLTGLIFKAISRNKEMRNLAFAITGIAGPLLNTILFMGTLTAFFYQTEYIQGFAQELGTSNVFTFILLFVGLNGVVETITCFILGTAVAKALDIFLRKM